jgi:hypothetical protein
MAGVNKKPKAEEIATEQADATAERIRDENGFELDHWGLPLVGPARLLRLADLGLPDPHEDPDVWAAPPLPPGNLDTENLKDKTNG